MEPRKGQQQLGQAIAHEKAGHVRSVSYQRLTVTSPIVAWELDVGATAEGTRAVLKNDLSC